MKTLAPIFTVIGAALLAKHIVSSVFYFNPHDTPQVAIAFLLLAIAINTRTQNP